MNIKNTKIYISIRNLYYTVKNRDEIAEKKRVYHIIEKYHNIHNGESCVIIGNGPSLRIEDLNMLWDLKIPTFGCNRVTKAFSQTEWRPTYYFISDEKMLVDYSDDVDGVPADHRFFPVDFKGRVTNGVFFLPSPVCFDYEKTNIFSFDAAAGIAGGGTVTYEMIQMAYYMGFSEIYLIGVDFNYNITNPLNAKECVYNGEENYFIKGYLKKGEVGNIPNMVAQLYAFNAAKKAIESKGKKIYNATRGGKLEIFERIDLDELFDSLG